MYDTLSFHFELIIEVLIKSVSRLSTLFTVLSWFISLQIIDVRMIALLVFALCIIALYDRLLVFIIERDLYRWQTVFVSDPHIFSRQIIVVVYRAMILIKHLLAIKVFEIFWLFFAYYFFNIVIYLLRIRLLEHFFRRYLSA